MNRNFFLPKIIILYLYNLHSDGSVVLTFEIKTYCTRVF